jgi:16S rRNA (cytosine967-C5)-methyltransferase
MAIFQIRYLDRIPAHAAVHDSVEIVKRLKRSAVAFTNAVLRKADRKPVRWPDRQIELSCPEWLMQRWSDHFGLERAAEIAKAALQEPIAYVRLGAGESAPNGLELEMTDVSGAYRVKSGPVHGIRLHDVGSQSVIPLLSIPPRSTYLDLCSAPGNKTLQALEAAPRLAVACDVSWARLKAVSPGCLRVVLDATHQLPFNTKFERVFIDAPCSGTGTLARNPEIKWRLRPERLTDFQAIQRRILLNGLKAVMPGGKLLYATCSLEPEENEDVVRSALEAHDGLRLESEHWRLPGRDPGDGFYAAVLVVSGAAA